MPFATIVDIRKSSTSQYLECFRKKYFMKICKHCEIELFPISTIIANGIMLAVGMDLLRNIFNDNSKFQFEISGRRENMIKVNKTKVELYEHQIF